MSLTRSFHADRSAAWDLRAGPRCARAMGADAREPSKRIETDASEGQPLIRPTNSLKNEIDKTNPNIYALRYLRNCGGTVGEHMFRHDR
jgi:hypothetical protein